MTYDQIIKHYTTQEAAARAAGVGQPAVAAWKKRGRVSRLAQLRLQAHSGGKLRADKSILASQA